MDNKATWIWYPGDFEVWLGNKFNNRRTERGAMFHRSGSKTAITSQWSSPPP